MISKYLDNIKLFTIIYMSETQFCVLTIGGGGIRGLSSIVFLQCMENEMKSIDPSFSILNQFDMFAGTSIGSWIIMLIVYKKYTMNEISEIFSFDLCNKIMDKSVWDKVMNLMQSKPKYDGVKKTEVIQHYLNDTKFSDTSKHVLVPTYDIENRIAQVFNSHTCSPKLLASEVADSSSSAPAYFPTKKIHHCELKNETLQKNSWFIDGGMVANNPAMCAITHAYNLLRTEPRRIVVINVGTGYRNRSIKGTDAKDFGGIEWILNDIIGIAMDESLVDQQAKLLLEEGDYINVNSPLIDASDDLDDCDPDNLNALIEMGKKWWDVYKEKIINIL